MARTDIEKKLRQGGLVSQALVQGAVTRISKNQQNASCFKYAPSVVFI
jgi:hypothetical protein